MSEMEQKTTQEMANSAAECIFAENMAEALTDDALDRVSGGYPRPPQAGPSAGRPIYDGKGRICGYERLGVVYYYKCPNCGRPMHVVIGLECTPCGISRGYQDVENVRWTRGKSSLITASTAL